MHQLYHYLFGSEPSEFVQRLIKNFSLSFVSVSSATVITFGIHIWVVRLIGPAEFGKLNIISSVAEFLLILPLFGLTSSASRYLSAKPESRQQIIGTIFLSVLAFFLIFTLAYPLVFPQIAHLFHFSGIPANLILLYTGCSVFFYLFQSFFQGQQQFKKYAILTIASAAVFVVATILFVQLSGAKTFLPLFYGNVFRMLLVIFVGVLLMGRSLLNFSKGWFKELAHYGSLHMLSAYAGFFSLGALDNLMINYYLGPEHVGLYAAYYAAFGVFVGRILSTFSQIFLPMASEASDVTKLSWGLSVFFKRLGLLIWIFVFGLIWLLFQFYGKAYVFDWRLAVMLSFNITLYSALMVLGNIVTSTGIRGARFGTALAFISALINVTFNALFIPKLGLFGVVIGSIAATSFSLISLSIVSRSHIITNGSK